jgi:ribosomal protein S6
LYKVKTYELLLILKTGLAEEKRKDVLETISKFITQNQGEILISEDWGTRELATFFKKNHTGDFFLRRFKSLPKALEEIKNYLAITETMVRYMVVDIETVESSRNRKINRGEKIEEKEKVEKLSLIS